MKETQTPRKDLSHRKPLKDSPSSKSSSSSFSDHHKKSHKVAKKNLNAVFSSVTEELSADSEVLVDSNANLNGESIDSFKCLLDGEETLSPSESSASSKITTVEDDSLIDTSNESNVFQFNGSLEAEVVANLLEQARTEVSSSNEVSPVLKKLLDALVDASVKEICALPEEKDLVSVVISQKTRVLVFCFAVWLITMTLSLMFFSSSSSRSTSSFYQPPT